MLTFFLLASPFLLVAPSGQKALALPPSLGDYFHNYASMTLENTLRLAGNGGNGQVPLGYNNFSLTAVFGIGILIMLVAGTVTSVSKIKAAAQNRAMEYISIQLALLITLLLVLGFIQSLSLSGAFGIKFFESSWVASTIRNPAKIFVTLLPLYALLLTLAIPMIRMKIPRRFSGYFYLGCVVIVLGYGWPLMRGDLGVSYSRGFDSGTLYLDKQVQEIAALANHGMGRAIIIPSDHNDEINFQGVSENLNTINLGGALPNTQKLIQQLTSTYNAQNSAFFSYLNMAGIENIFIKKNTAPQSNFSILFPSVLSYSEARKFLSAGGLEQVGGNNEYTQMSNSNYIKIISSPQTFSTSNSNDLDIAMAFNRNHQAFLFGGSKAILGYGDTYSTVDLGRRGNMTISTGKAILRDPSLVSILVSKQTIGGQGYLTVSKVDPISNNNILILRSLIPQNVNIIKLNGQYIDLKDRPTSANVRAGITTIGLIELSDSLPSKADLSFEKLQSRSLGQQQGSILSSSDSTDGHRSAELTARNLVASLSKPLPLEDLNSTYKLSFQYKTIKGSSPAYSLWQTGTNSTLLRGELSTSNSWTQVESYFQPSIHAKGVKLFLYQAPRGQSRFDAVKIQRVPVVSTVKLDVTPYDPVIELTNYQFKGPQTTSANLLSDPSFENGTWNGVGDASLGIAGAPKVKATRVANAIDGKYALALETANHTAYVSSMANGFQPNVTYKISFYYRNIRGQQPSFAVWQTGVNKPVAGQILRPAKEWQYFEEYFTPQEGASGLKIYFYSSSNGGTKTINMFDDVNLQIVSPVERVITKTRSSNMKIDSLVRTYKRVSPTKFEVELSKGKGIVAFNESYDVGWTAYLGDSPQPLQNNTHLIFNGWANAWFVDTSDLQKTGDNQNILTLEYRPQKHYMQGIILSGLTLLVSIAFLAYFRIKPRRNNK